MKTTTSKISTKLTLLIAIAFGSITGLASGEENPTLGVTLDTTYASKYMWRGYNVFGENGSFQPSLDVDLFGSGFSVNAWGAIPLGSGSESLTELDYTLAYGITLFEEESYAVDLGANFIYYDFPKVNSKATPDSHEFGISVALPNLFSIGEIGIVPSYYVGKLWPASSSPGFDVAGFYHSLGLGSDLPIPGTDLALSLSADINYNDGMFGADHDWSHATLGVSTGFAVGSVSISPFLNYQISMEDTVNPEDELFGGLSVSFAF